MNLSELLEENLIRCQLNGKNKYQVIEELIDLIDEHRSLENKELALQNVIEREQYLSTGLENGLAVPHGKSNGVTRLVMAFGISQKGIDFDSLDGKATQLVFLIMSPKDTSGPHIQALAQITRKLKSANLRNSILQASSAKEIMDLLKAADGEN